MLFLLTMLSNKVVNSTYKTIVGFKVCYNLKNNKPNSSQTKIKACWTQTSNCLLVKFNLETITTRVLGFFLEKIINAGY